MSLFKKCSFVNKHGICEWGLLSLYGHEEILVNSSSLNCKKKLALVLSKIQVSDLGPSWPSCFSVIKSQDLMAKGKAFSKQQSFKFAETEIICSQQNNVAKLNDKFLSLKG